MPIKWTIAGVAALALAFTVLTIEMPWLGTETKLVEGAACPADAPQATLDFTLNDLEGRPVTLSDHKGKVILLDLWATWCGPCKVEIPWFIEFQQRYADQGFTVLGISLDEAGWKAVQPYMQEVKVNYPMMIGNGEVAGLFGGIRSLPTTLLVDRAGRIVSTHVGLVGKGDYQSAIEALLNP